KGKTLRKNLGAAKETNVSECQLCEGICGEISHFVDLVLTELEGYEFETFLIGSKIDEDVLKREEEIFEFAKSEYVESIKNEVNREMGKILEPKLSKEVNFENPTIMAVIDTAFDTVHLQIASLFIYGRYNKYSREIPQTKWFCRICRGKGCKKCNYTGQMYSTSVEQLVAEKFLKATKGKDESFHGCGREDIDARMLGTGRPFVLEIKNPCKRNLDLSKIGAEINKENKDIIKVSELRYSNKDEIVRIKAAKFRKKYKVKLKCEELIDIEKFIKAVQSLQNIPIAQYTPSRVAHRRADMLRGRNIYNSSVDSIDGAIATLTLEAESGTYIKELISGDSGRTKPSISELIGIPCIVTELDVIEIKEGLKNGKTLKRNKE
ncbi:MAG: tRNA pseudouridine(54/55) synthase Pus10, partial [Candidatus Thermoplasmatota archaeon]|nr:tRNA pseudouridine(54/55) synthase Pus10 [Candidatus Thermoplasmatota archaeon]